MWQNWFNGILGLWVILIVFLGFSSTLTSILLIISGLVISVFGFWSALLTKPSPKNSESEILPSPPSGAPAEESPKS